MKEYLASNRLGRARYCSPVSLQVSLLAYHLDLPKAAAGF